MSVISDDRLNRLEADVRCIKAMLARIEARVIHINVVLVAHVLDSAANL